MVSCYQALVLDLLHLKALLEKQPVAAITILVSAPSTHSAQMMSPPPSSPAGEVLLVIPFTDKGTEAHTLPISSAI